MTNKYGLQKKYEQALERAKVINPGTADYEVAVKIFPELKESEDERIKAEIIAFVEQSIHRGGGTPIPQEQEKRWLAWLEKQGEQKPGDKVEPKFKAGNWYLCLKDFFGKGVRFVKGHAYYCGLNGCLQEFENGAHIAIVEKLYDYFNLWTIKDAKDGDVLVTNNRPFIFRGFLDKCYPDCPVAYCGISCTSRFYVPSIDNHKWTSKLCTPATKEQCDTLERAMTNAGYRWNKEELKLEKI